MRLKLYKYGIRQEKLAMTQVRGIAWNVFDCDSQKKCSGVGFWTTWCSHVIHYTCVFNPGAGLI